ncbi:hypothetical protein D3C75_572790 [compost metagenome]
MESVAQNNLRTSGFNFFRRHPFYGAVSANWHKSWRFYYATVKHQAATAGASIGGI